MGRRGLNGRTGSPSLEIVRAELKRRPDIPARTLARELHAKHPKIWDSVEHARQQVSFAIGQKGKTHRALNTVEARASRNPADDWRKYLPAPKRTIKEPWGLFKITGAHRALILSDVHCPFYDEVALSVAIDYGRERDATLVLLNGDAMDCYALSRWEKNPELRDFPGEVRAGRDMLRAIRTAFPKARIIWKWGNHEERYDAHLRLNPDFFGLDDWEWDSVFRLGEYGVELVRDKRPIMIGKLSIIHGHEYGRSFVDPVSPARTFFLRAGVNVLGGHYHRTSQHSKRDLRQTVVSAWSSGCLCEDHPAYRPLNDSNQGFAFVTVDQRGAFNVENPRIIDGKAW